MIHLVIGKQGSGKTLYLVKKAYDYYMAGKAVYSNVKLNFPYMQLNYKDIINCKLQDGIVILDEIHLLLPARRALSRVNKEICDGFLSMVRKKNLVVYGSTQYERKVDIRFREEKDYLHICKKYALINGKFQEIIHNQNLPKKIKILVDVDILELFSNNQVSYSFIGNDYFDLYDTKQIIKIKGL